MTEVFRTPDERFEDLAGYPFEPNYFELEGDLDGLRMHYVDEGEGKPVVLLHGEPTWSYLYRKMIPSLSKARRVLAPDYIGFGRSDKVTKSAPPPPSQGTLDDAEAPDHRLGGILQRYCRGVIDIKLRVELETSCPVPGSYCLDTIATVKLADLARDGAMARLQLEVRTDLRVVPGTGSRRAHRASTGRLPVLRPA